MSDVLGSLSCSSLGGSRVQPGKFISLTKPAVWEGKNFPLLGCKNNIDMRQINTEKSNLISYLQESPPAIHIHTHTHTHTQESPPTTHTAQRAHIPKRFTDRKVK